MSVASRTKFVHDHDMKNPLLVQFKLMLPAALKARVETVATANRRSLSQEIVASLEEKYPVEDTVIFSRLYRIAKAAGRLEALSQEDREFASSLEFFLDGRGQKPTLEKLHWVLQQAELSNERWRDPDQDKP